MNRPRIIPNANCTLQAHVFGMYDGKENMEDGGDCLLPPSFIQQCVSTVIDGPMIFRIMNPATQKFFFCGVTEFTAEEGAVVLPSWRLANIGGDIGTMVAVQLYEIPPAHSVQLQPQEIEFLELADPVSALEATFHLYGAIMVGEMLTFCFQGKKYRIKVTGAEPARVVHVKISRAIDLKFDEPPGYAEYIAKQEAEKEKERKRQQRPKVQVEVIEQKSRPSGYFATGGRSGPRQAPTSEWGGQSRTLDGSHGATTDKSPESDPEPSPSVGLVPFTGHGRRLG